jgi:hypothetical protein
MRRAYASRTGLVSIESPASPIKAFSIRWAVRQIVFLVLGPPAVLAMLIASAERNSQVAEILLVPGLGLIAAGCLTGAAILKGARK